MFTVSSLLFWKARRIARIPADTYPTPTVSACSPTTPTTAGGTTITITGTGFLTAWGVGTAQSVYFDTTQAVSFTIVSATRIDAVTPAHAAGPVAVVVNTLGGCASKPSGVTFT